MPEFESLFYEWGGVVFALLGACLGSFANLLIHRLPRQIPVTAGRSRCPECQKTLQAISLIPILSWIGLKGRCLNCKTRISWRYPLVEVASAAIFVLCHSQYGVSLTTLILGCTGIALLVLSLIDFEHLLIPDALQITLAILGICLVLTEGRPLIDALLLAAGGVALGLALRQLMRWWKKREGLGLGDVKLMGVCGLFLMPELVPVFLFLAGISGVMLGLILRRKEDGVFPFGPALALALFLCALWPETFFNYFRHAIDFLVELSM